MTGKHAAGSFDTADPARPAALFPAVRLAIAVALESERHRRAKKTIAVTKTAPSRTRDLGENIACWGRLNP